MLSHALQAVQTFFLMRGGHVVECPETRESAGVVVDALHAASTSVRGSTKLRLRSCSRWPERSACAQQCVRQIETAPADCSVKTVLTKWYADKECVLCKEPFNAVDWTRQKATLMRPDGTIAEWCEFRPEQIPSAFQTHLPVCWNCYADETFRNQHPELYS